MFTGLLVRSFVDLITFARVRSDESCFTRLGGYNFELVSKRDRLHSACLRTLLPGERQHG